MSTVSSVQQIPHAAPVVTKSHRLQIWTFTSMMVLVPLLAIAGGQGGVLRIVYPLLTLMVSGFLYARSKPLYFGLVLWLWFFTPFLGRMAEYQSGWSASDPVLVCPYLAAGISAMAMLSDPRRLGKREAVPYVCCLAAILYGTIIGLPRYPLFDVFRAVLNWVVPIFFAFFVLEHKELYPQFRKVIEKSFLFGLLISGAYGIWQFFNLPDWDKQWMMNAQLNSFGKAEDMAVRVFSTMNAPAIFAAITACGLLLLFNMKGRLRLLAAPLAFVALVLTMGRSAWLSLIAGFVYLATQVPMRQVVRLAAASVACCLVLLAFAQIPSVKDLVDQRFSTFTDPSQDVSFTARVAGHEQALSTLVQEPFGEGIGSTDAIHNTEGDDDIIGPHDSTLLESLYSLGWIGSGIYAVGVILLLLPLLGSGKDPFVLSSKAIVVGLLVQFLLNSIMLGVLGFMIWTFASLVEVHNERAREGAELSEVAEEEASLPVAA